MPVPEEDWDEAYELGWEGPTCTICDAVGHGYPGSLSGCPLEGLEPADPRDYIDGYGGGF